jgi:hypothetical protein
MSEVSAAVGSLGGRKATCQSHLACGNVLSLPVSHHVFRVQTLVAPAGPSMGKGRYGVVVRRGNRRALAYPPWWGVDERRLLGAPDGSPSSPFVSVYRAFCFSFTGAVGVHGGHFPLLHHTNKPCKALSLSACMCCLCVTGVGEVSPA